MLRFKQVGCAEARERGAARKWDCEGEWMKSRGGIFHLVLVIRYCFAVGQTVLEIAWQSMVVVNFQLLVNVVS